MEKYKKILELLKGGGNLSESCWMCLNCGLIFQWHWTEKLAHYKLIFGDKSKEISIPIPGKNKPNYCPNCNFPEVDSLEW